MAITALPTPPSRTDPTNFAMRADAFMSALPQFVIDANATAQAMNLNSTNDTSASSVLIGTGAKTFTVSPGKSFQPGMWLVIASTAAPSTNAVYGTITSYSGTTLLMNIYTLIGSGTLAAWTISQSAPGGVLPGANTNLTSLTGLTTALSIPQGGTGANTATAGADALGAFRRGTLLGTVSQAAGIPTGAVIERGSNANGEYVRFADGTQICTFATGALPASTGNYVAGLYASSFTWTYPAAFTATASLSGGGSDQSVIGWISQAGIGSATASNYVYFSAASSITGAVRTLMAIGRWF